MKAGYAPDRDWVTDEVWASLDPMAGRLSRRTVRRFLAASAVTLGFGIVAGLLLWQGLLSPRISAQIGGGGTRIGSSQVTVQLELINHGPRPVQIASLAASSGLELTSATGLPHRLGAHSSRDVTVRVRIVDCSAVRSGSGSLDLRIDRFWGHTTKRIDLASAFLIRKACAGS
jgi:hypothetical protein